MYRDHFLELIRISETAEDVFMCGNVRSEMKKSTLYNVNIKLNFGGMVIECQCDCPVGVGPGAHCKHSCVILHTVAQQKDSTVAKDMCTQVLQTFQVKEFKGLPVKTSSLRVQTTVAMQTLASFDPQSAR